MKNTIIKTMILFLLAIPFKSEAQKYRKMLGDSSVWYEVFNAGLGGGTAIYTIAGDTSFGGLQYKRPANDKFYLREDTLTQQIFFKRADSLNLQEKILYDFSKKVGDTIYSYYIDFYSNQYYARMIENRDTGYIIDSIRILPMLGDSLHFFYGHYLGYYNWRKFELIEAVGFSDGFRKPFGNSSGGIFIKYSCKFIDGVHQYKAPKGTMGNWYEYILDTSCYINKWSTYINTAEKFFSIYPNPFSNKLIIEGKPLQNCKAEVYDITGKLMETIIINGNEINFNNYYNGLVLIRVFDRQGNVVGVVKGMRL